MWFLKYFFWGTAPKKAKVRDRRYYIKRVILALAVIALLYGCSTCGDCTSGRGQGVDRIPPPVSNLSVVFANEEACLYWTDAADYNLDHIEVSWEPNWGRDPVIVAKGIEQYRISGLAEGTEYRFTVKTVDKWGNKSLVMEGGTGAGFRQKESGGGVSAGIKGTPAAEQATLSWTNLADSEYDYVEISYDYDSEPVDGTPADNRPLGSRPSFRVLKGVASKTLVNLVNNVEHTFYAVAVDSQGNRKPLPELGLYISGSVTAPESFVGRSSGNQIVLVWKDPHNIQFDYVEVAYGSSGGITPLIVDKGVQAATLTGLSDVSDCEFSVYVVDAAGNRRPLTSVLLLTPELPLFNGPDADKMVVRGVPVAGQVILSWEDPVMEDIDHIAILYEPDGSEDPVTVEAGQGTRTIVGLADGKEYFFLAYGVDSENNNRVITGLQLTTPTLPRLVVTPVSGRVNVLWSDPHDPALRHIEVSYSPGGESPVRVSRGREGHTFTNLSDDLEYEFKVTATASTGNVYAVIARVTVPRLSVLTGTPTNRQMSLSWVDPTNINIDRVEIVYSPGGERPVIVGKGVESRTFYNLTGNQYTFTIYARDGAGNRYPVESARFYDPNTAFVVDSAAPARVGELRPLNWRAANSAAAFESSSINAISFGIASNGTTRWVAGGGEGKIAYSNDSGVTWARVSDSAFGYYSIDTIGYGNGRWVAGGKNGRIAWSPNGIAWTAATKTQTVNNNVNTVAYGDGRWLAGCSDGVMLVSVDNGTTWRTVSTDVFARSAINTIVYHDGRWVAGGAGGKIAWSADNGVTWTAVANSTFGSSIINVIVYDRERWVAGGYGQRAAWSEDGVTWQPLARPFFILCLGYNGYRWIVGGQDGRMAWSGNSGDAWVVDEQGQGLFGANWIQSAASGRGPNGGRRWLVGGQSGKIIFADEQF